MRLQHGQRERVERQHVLSILRLAVGLDHPAVHHDSRDLDRQGSGVEVKAAPLRSAAARRRAGLCLGRPARRTPGQHAQTPPVNQLIANAPEDAMHPHASWLPGRPAARRARSAADTEAPGRF